MNSGSSIKILRTAPAISGQRKWTMDYVKNKPIAAKAKPSREAPWPTGQH